MAPHTPRPRWWQLYLLCALFVASFLMEARLPLSAGGHQADQIGILILVFAAALRWLHANAARLESDFAEHGRWAMCAGEAQPIDARSLVHHPTGGWEYTRDGPWDLNGSEIKPVEHSPIGRQT
jgi:hypothetical protein